MCIPQRILANIRPVWRSSKRPAELTSRQMEVLQLVAEGNANKQTAAKLGISIKTVVFKRIWNLGFCLQRFFRRTLHTKERNLARRINSCQKK
jgi:FixJ family two-component response regulator